MRFNIHQQATKAVVLRGRCAQTIYTWTLGIWTDSLVARYVLLRYSVRSLTLETLTPAAALPSIVNHNQTWHHITRWTEHVTPRTESHAVSQTMRPSCPWSICRTVVQRDYASKFSVLFRKLSLSMPDIAVDFQEAFPLQLTDIRFCKTWQCTVTTIIPTVRVYVKTIDGQTLLSCHKLLEWHPKSPPSSRSIFSQKLEKG